MDRVRQTLLPHGLTIDILLFDQAGRPVGAAWRDADAEAHRTRIAAAAAVIRVLPAGGLPGWVSTPAVGSLLGYDRSDPTDDRWIAVVMEPLGEAFGPMREMDRRLVVALLAVLLGALAVATYLAGRMSQPLRALTRATREIAIAGVPASVVDVASRDEIGELGRAFNAMAAALQRAQDDLLAAAKFAFVGEVAAGVAHEVRTPLGILRSSAQMLERSVPKDRPEVVELASMMVGEVDRLDRVVDGLLELARPHDPQVEPTALETILTRAVEFVDAQARDKRIAIACEFAARPSVARCDPDQIYHVALNLIVNALQILPAGGHIVLRTLPRHDGRVGFAVRDDGPGIPPDAQPRIFTPFFSLRPGGTGLGLALVQRVVHEHQGTVGVESAVGRGTTFRVELPAAEDRS
jgi:two-component system, NtrC family, sensor histidine kinase HydH